MQVLLSRREHKGHGNQVMQTSLALNLQHASFEWSLLDTTEDATQTKDKKKDDKKTKTDYNEKTNEKKKTEGETKSEKNGSNHENGSNRANSNNIEKTGKLLPNFMTLYIQFIAI